MLELCTDGFPRYSASIPAPSPGKVLRSEKLFIDIEKANSLLVNDTMILELKLLEHQHHWLWFNTVSALAKSGVWICVVCYICTASFDLEPCRNFYIGWLMVIVSGTCSWTYIGSNMEQDSKHKRESRNQRRRPEHTYLGKFGRVRYKSVFVCWRITRWGEGWYGRWMTDVWGNGNDEFTLSTL